VGIADAHIFAKSWNAEAGTHDTKESIDMIGKKVYAGAWVDPKVTTPISTREQNVVKIAQEIGVVYYANAAHVDILLNQGVVT
jgi:hypothetical protein